jgi:hypothetical protein
MVPSLSLIPQRRRRSFASQDERGDGRPQEDGRDHERRVGEECYGHADVWYAPFLLLLSHGNRVQMLTLRSGPRQTSLPRLYARPAACTTVRPTY